MLEFQNGEVRCQSCLLSLFTHYTHADVCHLNHTHVVASITNTQHYLPSVILDPLSYDCLLSG